MLEHADIKKYLLLLLVAVVVFGIFFVQQNHLLSKSQPQPTPTPIQASSGNIVVDAPYKDAALPTRFLITGKARVFENVVSVRVTSKLLGKVYYEGTTMAQAPDAGTFGNFATQVTLSTKGDTLRPNDKLIIEVYQSSAKDGSEIDVVTIPIYFSPELP